MRVVEEIPDDLFKITIYSYNEKYILQIALDQFQQSYKFPHVEFNLQEVKDVMTENFLDGVFKRFLAMRKDCNTEIKSIKTL